MLTVVPSSPAPKKKRIRRPEQRFQAELVRTLALTLTPETTFFAIPNGGKRSKVEAAILVGQGVMPGAPDLLFIHGGRAFGMELKAGKGVRSPSQRLANIALQRAGMPPVPVVRTLDEALAHLSLWGIPTRILKVA